MCQKSLSDMLEFGYEACFFELVGNIGRHHLKLQNKDMAC